MSERLCPRCHTLLTYEDYGVLFYCSHCGAPQVQLSEELREQAAEAAVSDIAGQAEVAGHFAAASLTSLDAADSTTVDWSEAVRAAGWGGLLAFGLGLISMPVPQVTFLVFLWALIAPIVVLGIYCARRKHTRIRAGFGARLGLVTGLAISVAIFIVDSVQLIFSRFVLHRGADLDKDMATLFTTLHQTQAANQQPMPFNDAVPEFRVGLLLFSIGFGVFLYLFYAVISGAFGGFLRSRSRTA
jgi:hypothetical protein